MLLLFDVDGPLMEAATPSAGQATERRPQTGARSRYTGDQCADRDGRPDPRRDRPRSCSTPGCRRSGSTLSPARCAIAVVPTTRRISPGRLLPDVRELPGLLTGNYEAVARLKLERAGIGAAFPEGQGAYGSGAEDRAVLRRGRRSATTRAPWQIAEWLRIAVLYSGRANAKIADPPAWASAPG
jgi:hypothetical protein